MSSFALELAEELECHECYLRMAGAELVVAHLGNRLDGLFYEKLSAYGAALRSSPFCILSETH